MFPFWGSFCLFTFCLFTQRARCPLVSPVIASACGQPPAQPLFFGLCSPLPSGRPACAVRNQQPVNPFIFRPSRNLSSLNLCPAWAFPLWKMPTRSRATRTKKMRSPYLRKACKTNRHTHRHRHRCKMHAEITEVIAILRPWATCLRVDHHFFFLHVDPIFLSER